MCKALYEVAAGLEAGLMILEVSKINIIGVPDFFQARVLLAREVVSWPA
jgi:hypothetical protein